MSERRPTQARNYELSFPAWFSPWGAAALCSVALAIAQASLLGSRWLTIAISLLSVSIAALGAWKTRYSPQLRDRVWFITTGTLSSVIILLICFAPGILNSRWEIDKTIPKPDPNQLALIPRNKPMEKGRPLSTGETVDAATDALRQDDVVVFIDSVKIGQVSGMGSAQYLSVQFRVVNTGQGQSISLEGFAEHRPVLSDSAGRSFAFVEQRLKQIKDRKVVFVDWEGRRAVEIQPRGAQDVLLIFESPPAAENLQLEVSSGAWGRQGTCRFRIAEMDPANP